ncbi:MAG: excinuclease ABC subunit UvrC [Sumerlaeia bacterium]
MPRSRAADSTSDLSEDSLAHLPTASGVYLMKDAKEKVIYVGKAKNLRNRVRSYFRESGDGRFHVQFLRSRVESIETIITSNEKEALLLENTLIKKHKPRYNIRLRDDKTYISLRLDTRHEWPRIHIVRKPRAGDKALLFGPYSSASSVKQTMRFLQRLFPLRSCTDRELTQRSRPCVLHQIDRCCAPCVDKADAQLYSEYVDQMIRFLQGDRDEVMKLLHDKMMAYSEDMQFEKAALVRDRIRAMERTIEEENVVSHRHFDRDVIAIARESGKLIAAVLCFRDGKLDESRTFKFTDPGTEDGDLMEMFLTQFYDGARRVPRDILLSHEAENLDLLAEALRQERGGAVRLVAPQRGQKRRLVEMAVKNARANLERLLAGEQTLEETLKNLATAIHIESLPRRIECFDISNFQGSYPVGSMVSFRDGEPDKANYRRFKIRDVEGQNDFAMMREVLTRRYGRLIREGAAMPDLVVIDGGIGQLNIAVEVWKDLGLWGEIPVVGLAKSRLKDRDGVKIRTEERVFLPGRKNPVTFTRSDPALHLLQRVRDETHRFGITFHRELRSRSALRSGLEDIPGVGPKRRGQLLRHFGSLAKIKDATADDLRAAPGMSHAAADAIWRHFHGREEFSENEN